MKKIKYIFFDLAYTLLDKPILYQTIVRTLGDFNIKVDEGLVKVKHRFLLDSVLIPQKSTKVFYDSFNSELLSAFGVIPSKKILDALYKNCSNLQWEKFSDIAALNEFSVPFGIISNWDSSLRQKLQLISSVHFQTVISSTEAKISKPDPRIYQKVIEATCLTADQIVYVGDSIRLDIIPALDVGIRAILIDRYNFYPQFKGEKITTLFELKNKINKYN